MGVWKAPPGKIGKEVVLVMKAKVEAGGERDNRRNGEGATAMLVAKGLVGVAVGQEGAKEK